MKRTSIYNQNQSLMIRSYRDLLVWQRALSLANRVYEVTSRLNKNGRPQIPTNKPQINSLIFHIQESAVSIPVQIAKGFGRGNLHEYVKCLKAARGSLYALHTKLEIGLNLEHFSKQEFYHLYEQIQEVDEILNQLIQQLERMIKDPVYKVA